MPLLIVRLTLCLCQMAGVPVKGVFWSGGGGCRAAVPACLFSGADATEPPLCSQHESSFVSPVQVRGQQHLLICFTYFFLLVLMGAEVRRVGTRSHRGRVLH